MNEEAFTQVLSLGTLGTGEGEDGARSSPLLLACFFLVFILPGVGVRGAQEDDLLARPWPGEFVESGFPFYSSVLDARDLGRGFPTNNLTARGLILNFGAGCWACFDVDLLRMSAVWTGAGVTPASMAQGSYNTPGHKAPEGEADLPRIDGEPLLVNGLYPGWQTAESLSLTDPRAPDPDPTETGRGPLPAALGRFRAVCILERGVRLEYDIGGLAVREWVRQGMDQGVAVIRFQFQLPRVPSALWLVLGYPGRSQDEALTVEPTAARIVAEAARKPDGLMALRLRPSARGVGFEVVRAPGTRGLEVYAWQPPGREAPPPRRWPGSVVTSAPLGGAGDAYVLDDIPLPQENPWNRHVRLADLAFLPDGRAAGVTFDGDVWWIDGLRGDLRKVEWRRFTSGFHEPLGICTRDGAVFVYDRNGIWRLRDTDGNGEADVHELFSNGFSQTAETREFASGIRTAPDGSFVIAKGGQRGSTVSRESGSVLRISRDAATTTVLAYGLRQPFIGVNPGTGMITASDQQGHYVPATALEWIRTNVYYGFLPLFLPKEQYPAPIADPLTWIPHSINASGAGQVWATDPRMGPVEGGLIHLGYYRPEIFRVLLNRRARRLQAAVVSLRSDLSFAPLAGTVNPADGQVYIAGFQIWGTTAPKISGLARLRYTGAPSLTPREIVPMTEGILLGFDVALDPAQATDPANYSAERWTYRRTANYGSPHYKTGGGTGQETLVPSSVYLSRDHRTVFVGIPDMQSVMQMRLGWALKTSDGRSFARSAYFTPYELVTFDPPADGFDDLRVDLTPRVAALRTAETPLTAGEGHRLSELMGCVACHSNDGSLLGKIGPTWKGLFGSRRAFADGTTTTADEDYLRDSIREPAHRIVLGYEHSEAGMPSYAGILSDDQVTALILYIESLR